MQVFELGQQLIDDYAAYVRSFIRIRDPRIAELVDDELRRGLLWPDPLVQLNPAFEPGAWVDELVADGTLHATCARIFRGAKTQEATEGKPMRLHRHQVDAIRAARAGANYVLTTGTGSGKSLANIAPIVDHVLRSGSGRGIQAIVVYPMNALANSQYGELEKFLRFGFEREPVRFERYTGQESDCAPSGPAMDAFVGNPVPGQPGPKLLDQVRRTARLATSAGGPRRHTWAGSGVMSSSTPSVTPGNSVTAKSTHSWKHWRTTAP